MKKRQTTVPQPDSGLHDLTLEDSSAAEKATTPRGCMLFVSDGVPEDRGQSLRAVGSEVSIGRGDECDLVLRDSNVSRRHVELSMVPGGILVVDTGSTNGIGYLGRRIERATLQLGARIKVGDTAIDLLPLEDERAIPAARVQQYAEMVGISLPMRRLFALLKTLEGSQAPVLIEGETGTGKELVARAIHSKGCRSAGPMVLVDCGNVPAEIMESELFGHRRGAFTGAIADRTGAFEAADGGTVFLDELGELPSSLQPKLLRVLESGQIKRLGDSVHRTVDIRIVAATKQRLQERVAQAHFREDLFYRVAVVHLRLPPLRERREDIPLLTEHLLNHLSDGLVRQISPEGAEHLFQRDWPGNVRELRNALQKMLALRQQQGGFTETSLLRMNSLIDLGAEGTEPSDQPSSPSSTTIMDQPFLEARNQILHNFEREYLVRLWATANGNISAAARRAEMDRKKLRNLLRKHGLL